MGLTWIIGFLVFEVPALLPLAYIFTIFVAFQGMAIFVLFVLLDKQVREAYSKWWKMGFGKYFEGFSFTRVRNVFSVHKSYNVLLSFIQSTSDTDTKSNDAISSRPTAPNTSVPMHILEPSVLVESTFTDILATTSCSNCSLSESAVDIDKPEDQSSTSIEQLKEHGKPNYAETIMSKNCMFLM